MSGRVVGLGLDLVDIERFRAVLARRPTLRSRLFSDAEQALAAEMADPAPTLAGRFAVKEATMKALGVGLGALDWTDVHASRLTGGAPRLEVGGRAAVLAADRGVRSWMLSITHTDLVAAAVVLAFS